MWQVLCDLRVALPCVVKAFYPDTQTVDVTPAITEKMNVNTGGVPVATDTALPLLPGVPIMMPRAGNFALTFPIQEGDECLVIFADNCYDAWWQNGGTANTQVDKRRHDLSDGIAIFGLWSQPNVLENYNTEAVELRSEDGLDKISLDGTQILIVSQNHPINLQATNSNITLQAGGDVVINANDGLTINGPAVFNGTAEFNSTVQIGSAISMTSTTATFGVTTTIQGKAFLTHEHSGVTTGTDHTGPVE
jgi:hypothetical protein